LSSGANTTGVMGLFGLVLGVGTFWVIIHAYWSLTSGRSGHYELPTSTSTPHRGAPRFKRFGHTTVQLHRLYLHVQSTSPRERFERLSRSFQKHERTRWRPRFIYLYDIGIIVCLLGLLTAVCFLAWTCIHMVFSIWHAFLSQPSQSIQHVRRSNLPEPVRHLSVRPSFSGLLIPLVRKLSFSPLVSIPSERSTRRFPVSRPL
jgi:hypothetical protein